MIRRWESTTNNGGWVEIDCSTPVPKYRVHSHPHWLLSAYPLQETIYHFEDQYRYKEVTNQVATPPCQHDIGYRYEYSMNGYVCSKCSMSLDDITSKRIGLPTSVQTGTSLVHKCRCDMTTLMRSGCQCNGI